MKPNCNHEGPYIYSSLRYPGTRILELLNELEDPELRVLASKLPNTVLHSQADNTVKKYLGAFKRWKTWAATHHLEPIPVKPHLLALYLQHLAEQSKSKAAVEEACNALSWIHSSAGLTPPLSDLFVKATLEGLQRSLAKPVVKKEPITVETLEAIVQDAEGSRTLTDLCLATTCLLGFSGFLRFSELINLRSCDFKMAEEMMMIKFRHSKTDLWRQGDEVVVARTANKTYPAARLECYMQVTGMSWEDECFLFRLIQATKNGQKLRKSGKVSYSCLREAFKKISDLGLRPEEFGLHSLRAGGATAAVHAKVLDRCFKRHRRWKSENAKDGYI